MLDNNSFNHNILWIFVHLHKSGGTTIKTHFANNIEWDKSYFEMSKWGDTCRKKNNRLPLQKRCLEERTSINTIAGHQVYYGIHEYVPGKIPRYFTVLRDPVERCLSMYNFRRSCNKTEKDFCTWYYTLYNKNYNPITKFYAQKYTRHQLPNHSELQFALAKKFIDSCWYIGITERLNKDLHYIFSTMQLPLDWKNYREAVAKPVEGSSAHPYKKNILLTKYEELSVDIRKKIYEDHPYDYSLYKYAKKCNEVFWQENNR